ncbi:PREDICTED: glutathione S-transferase T3-like [Brassica oleracea var. oleracea]|uniref:glutathione S-transferase T3-like n=1 Tax=Brassica oleracea var. oleracea TaxID=109376 RepID=UPI0006A71769|nr:PREDICTED: glutathione S-transferase T3-like [Brassica oleracea var. oleracea]
MECFILSGPHASLSEGFNLIKARYASVFGTQWADDGNEDELVVSDRKERRKWSPTEDLVLISAWLNTSKDPVVRNEQKAIAFWKPATKAKSSGMNEDDVLKMAHEIFFNDYKVKFTLEHAWLELRHDKKWCGASSTKEKVSSKRRKLDDQSTQSLTSKTGCDGEDEVTARPIGVKAAKAKAKSKPTTSEEAVEFQSLWEIKQKDFVFKEKLNKQKLLDSLIAKTEPLTELELTLKDKLITEMLLS